MRYIDPETGTEHARSTGKVVLRDAEREAGKWEKELNEGTWKAPSRLTVEQFRERLENEKLTGLSAGYAATMHSVFEHFESIIGKEILISRITPEVVSRFQSSLRANGIKESTIRTYLKHFKAALAWAAEIDLIRAAPKIQLPKHARTKSRMKGRPISNEEFKRMLSTAESVRPDDFQDWQRYLTGLWLSGLRLSESLILSWDDDSDFSVDLYGRRPRFKIQSEGQKAKRDELLPMTPDFATWLLQTPPEDRYGVVFKPGGYQQDKVMRVVSAIGAKANVKVGGKKHATAHDLRRSFGTRWSLKVRPAVLQKLMRHADIKTTMEFYVSHEADDIADELWRNFE
ncbi:tyrosine-type recombinase/integrase [Planctomicrobium sp. SH661]|uniref:tyrosine-type recombinase/integrase n=1 Tax=Planctomicrobium sp. SH661 TaxID=3448124 RepID=UPI003F5B9169